MIIKRMTATFGRLKQDQLELAPGLNIICAPNESGKSTWCAFLRAMFYGISTSDRDKKGYLADKNRYQPWSGAPMEGEVDLVWRGRDITLRRFTKGRTPFSGFSAVYTGTQEPVPELTGQTCGEQLLGVGREVWERSAFLGQAPTLAIDGTPELERRISALFSSGQEDVSFSQTQSVLKKWQNARRHNRTGRIPELERELERLDGILANMHSANERIAHAQAGRLTLQQQQAELTQELHDHEHLEQQDLARRFLLAQEQKQRLRDELDRLEQEQQQFSTLPPRRNLLDMQETLQYLKIQQQTLRLTQQERDRARQAAQSSQEVAQDSPFPGLTGAQALSTAHRDAGLVDELNQRAGRTRHARLWAAPLLCLGLVPVFFAKSLPLATVVGIPIAAVAAVAALLVLLSRRAQASSKKAAQILAQYRTDSSTGITAAAQEFARRDEAARLAQQESQRRQNALDDQQAAYERTLTELVCSVRAFYPSACDLATCTDAVTLALELEHRLTAAQERLSDAARHCDDLRAQGAKDTPIDYIPDPPAREKAETQRALQRVNAALAMSDREQNLAEGELASLGDPAALEAQRERTCQELERRRQEYEALELALEALEAANTTLQQRFAPELNQRASEIMGKLTQHRYASVTLDRTFDASARSEDSLLPHSVLTLSRGTADQLYLAVRLAVCTLCLPQDDPSPLVLDDALLSFDDARMRSALDLLAGMDRQILLFSCQQREALVGKGNILHLNF